MLLVDHHQAQPGELHVLLHQRLRADHQIDLSRPQCFQRLPPFLLRPAAGQQQPPHPAVGEVALQRAEVLPGQHLGRGHQGGLMLVGHGDEQGVDGDGGLARADVGLEEPLHRPFAGQVAADLGDDLVLVAGQREREQPADARVEDGACRQHRRPAAVAHLAAAQRQRQLQEQEFLVDEAPPRPRRLLQGRREVDGAQRLRRAGPVVQSPQRLRQVLDDMAAVEVERLADERPEVVRPQAFGQRVDRHDARRRRPRRRRAICTRGLLICQWSLRHFGLPLNDRRWPKRKRLAA